MTGRIAGSLLGLALACAACAPADPAPAAAGQGDAPGSIDEAILAEFEGLCTAMRDSDNEYYGLGQIEELSGHLSRSLTEPLPRVVTRARLGMEYLRIGETDRAVELLTESYTIAVREQVELPILLDVTRRLALAQLRKGEQSNCIGMHGPASCIVPFREEARHRDTEGSRRAIQYYDEYLTWKPQEPTPRWLMNLAAMTLGKHPEAVPEPYRISAGSFPVEGGIGRFVDRAYDSGFRVRRPSGGLVLDDFDGDGLLDIVTSTIDPCQSLTFHHNLGDGTFEDRTASSGLLAQLGGLNLIHGDYDNDGDLDLLVLRGGWMGAAGKMRNSLLDNDGSGRFRDVTREAGLAEPAYPTQTGAFADYDNDGDLDLYIGNESDQDLYAGGQADSQIASYPSQLYRNEGDRTFTEVALAAGVTNDRFAKGVAWGDYDNDGDPDLYVSNIGVNRLYRNEGDGTFFDVARQAGVTEPEGRSFPTWFFDYDNDGWLDLFVADYNATIDDVAAFYLEGVTDPGMRPRLYRNRGDGRFDEIGEQAGLVEPALPMGANFGDLDNDGYPDFYLGTGDPSFESLTPNLMYLNQGGETFRNITFSSGFGHLQKGHGIAFGDVDHDGDQDVLEQMGGALPGDGYPSVLYENPGHGRAWVVVEVVGERSNRDGIGTRIRVVARTPEGNREIHLVVGGGGSFGGSSLRQEIGLGDATSIALLELNWPAGGAIQRFRELDIRRHYRIREGADSTEVLSRPAFRLGGP